MVPRVKGSAMRAALLALCASMASAANAPAAEPIVGHWLLTSQEVNGRKAPAEEMVLRVTPSGQSFEFAYSVPVNNIQFVSMRFVSRLDGKEASVTNANGQKIGTIQVKRAASGEYKIMLQGEGRPTASGTMRVSADGKTLKSESEAKQDGKTTASRTVQYFSRQ
jgi:autotransporter adhesin